MLKSGKMSTAWQLRLDPSEDKPVTDLARRRGTSKNDVVRLAVRLLLRVLRVEHAVERGGRLLIERRAHNRKMAPVEVWLL
jgi:hypothetical protein